MPTIQSEGCYVFNRPVPVVFSTRPLETITADPMADLLSRCKAAARLNLRGEKYSADDVEDCAAKVMNDVLTRGEASAPRCYCGAPADYTRRSPAGTDDQGAAITRGLCIAHRNRFPSRRITPREYVKAEVSFGTLSGMASNYRRSIDRDRKRDADQAERDAVEFSPDLASIVIDGDSGRLRLTTPETARVKALEMADALGVRPLRKRDANLYALLYMAARSATMLALDVPNPAERAAAELGLTEQGAKDATRRAVKSLPDVAARPPVPSPVILTAKGAGRVQPADQAGRRKRNGDHERIGVNPARLRWSDALLLPDTARAIKASKSRSEAHRIGQRHDGWRDQATAIPAPVIETRLYGCAPCPADQAAWAAAPPIRSADQAGQTTRPTLIPRATALRLHRAATLRRKDRARRTDAERAAKRLSAGLPVDHCHPAVNPDA